eukprot:CAMPEP_0169096940 /NCGR_PEP_ID=MMETSP1015-20121227/19260_1 /TAXON_ID=342587 /ORGANISM="Karlodinium micrum, Strain CCMP2283" /LENGTH=227 /DNA_ID=CAMNT_0009157725 /DNA_START=60 /DNA_END=743 /DNA_ORIENTATION=+
MSRVTILSWWVACVGAVSQSTEEDAADSLASLLLAAGASTPASGGLLSPSRSAAPTMWKRCDLTGAKPNYGKQRVTFSNKHSTHPQWLNLQEKRFWWEEGNQQVKMKVTVRALRTIRKLGLDEAAKKYKVDLKQFVTGRINPAAKMARKVAARIAKKEREAMEAAAATSEVARMEGMGKELLGPDENDILDAAEAAEAAAAAEAEEGEEGSERSEGNVKFVEPGQDK